VHFIGSGGSLQNVEDKTKKYKKIQNIKQNKGWQDGLLIMLL
jgi:hypothetical protein